MATQPSTPAVPLPPRVLTVRQPWASLIMVGAKRVENRTWRPPPALARRQLLIHAARRPAPLADWAAAQATAGRELEPASLPYGAVLGAVTLTGHHPEPTCRSATGFPCSPWAARDPSVLHWTLADPRPLARPLPCPGALGLWRLPDRLVAHVASVLQPGEVEPC